MRGEDFVRNLRNLCKQETPPHAWGRSDSATCQLYAPGNTPTCVGKTSSEPPCPPSTGETPPHAWGRLRMIAVADAKIWKHPHMRGEDQKALESKGIGYRNTPTCVGKTIKQEFKRGPKRKHPHMRGEDGDDGGTAAQEPETPPHAWGRRVSFRCALGKAGNTPTCVGKTPEHPERS